MIWLEGDLRETLSWNYIRRTSSIRYCFFLFFGCFLWRVFENSDLVQNWLQGSSSLTSNITLRGGFFFGYNWCCIMYFEIHTSKQFDLEIKNLQLFRSLFFHFWGLSWHFEFEEEFPTSNKLTSWRIAHSNSTNAALLFSDLPRRRANGQILILHILFMALQMMWL
jgi:hypothetical protein